VVVLFCDWTTDIGNFSGSFVTKFGVLVPLLIETVSIGIGDVLPPKWTTPSLYLWYFRENVQTARAVSHQAIVTPNSWGASTRF